MARRTHSTLSYEAGERRKLNLLVPYLSDKMYECEKILGKVKLKESVWTYLSGVTFRDLNNSQFSKFM